MTRSRGAFTALAAVLAAVLAGCLRPEYVEPDPVPAEPPSPLPRRVLRHPPDFTFTEYATGKRFFYRTYSEPLGDDPARAEQVRELLAGSEQPPEVTEEGELRHEVITVLDPQGPPYERAATPEERAYALGVIEEDWKRKGFWDRLEFHERLVRAGRERRASLLDARSAYLERAIRAVRDELLVLEADYQASTKTQGYQPPPGHVEFLGRQIAEKRAQLADLEARRETLRFLRADLDRRTERSTKASAE